MYQDIRKQTIARMKKNRTFIVEFSDRKLNERPYIEVLSINNEQVYSCVVKRVSYNKKTDKFYFTSTNLLNGEMVTSSEDSVLSDDMCEKVFTNILV
jgi:hypothetical protein|nr:MAG TPA: hypothetical protein [Ackermannviridae sp.]